MKYNSNQLLINVFLYKGFILPRIKFFIRPLLIGLLVGNLTFSIAPNPIYSQSLLTKEDSSLDESEEKKSEPDLETGMQRRRYLRYSQDRWNLMRERLEKGESFQLETPKPAPAVLEKVEPTAPVPVGPGLNVVLPYESGLSISGRKVIDFKLTSTIYAQPDSGKGRVNKTDFQLDQQLQVRVKGTVGRKVSVNVDFDDTREDKRNIWVEYKGDPDEVLQNAAFGDITISLPSTYFVSYTKSVFGAKAELMFRPRSAFTRYFPGAIWPEFLPKQIRTYMIGSRTKGITKTKRFTGQSILNRKELNDINYVRRQFFQLAFSTGSTSALEHRPIKVGSEKIFIDDQIPTNNNIHETTRTFKVFESSLTAVGGTTFTTATFTGPAGPNTGVFKQLVPGLDYSVDYIKGIIRFKKAIQLKDILVVDYIPAGQTQPFSQTFGGADPLITNPNGDTALNGFQPILLKPDETQFFATRELKNFYNLGDTRIVRDDGRGNFLLKILDLDHNEPSQIVGLDVSSNTQTKSVPKYPNDIDVDFENGIISFVSTDTFRSPILRPFPDDIYIHRDFVPLSKNRYRVFAEYRFKKGNFHLDNTNIVSLSEQVYMDGKKMVRDIDYFVDYDLGIITFFRPELIREDSIIEITYDFSPFGGQGEETLVGIRNEFYLTDNLFLGSSVLFNFAPRTTKVPDLRSVSRSITVIEGDFNWKNVKFGESPFQISNLSGEIAHSIKNPNTADKALLESFEGVKLEDAALLNKDSWQVSSNPQRGNPSAGGGAFSNGFANALTLSNEDVKVTDINPQANTETQESLQALKIDYNFTTNGPSEAMSIAQTLSKAGVDFYTNRRQFLDVWVHGDASNATLKFRLGGIAEASDSDSSGVLKTEDLDNNGTLSPGEDTGWSFTNPNGSTTTIGNANGRLDTEDLDGNGRLDADDTHGNYLNEASVTVDFTGWKIVQIPLNIATSDQARLDWSTIKQMRVTVVNPVSTAKSGTIRLGRLSVVGTRFTEASIDPSSAAITSTVFAENNRDNPNYPSLVNHPAYQDLYEITDDASKKREQALAIQYQRTAATLQTSTVTTKETFSVGLDISEHESLKFFLYGDGSGNNFLFRIGTPDNFLEYTTPLTFTGWRVIELDILDKNPRDGKLDRNDMKAFGNWQRRVGNPDLRNIKEITMGVVLPAGGPDASSSKIYVNEIHLTGAIKITGIAYRANADFNLKGWGNWGANWNFQDRNFQTLTTVGSGVDTKNGGAYLNFDRLKFLPLNSNLSYSETVTPQIQTVDDPNILVSKIDEGKAIKTGQSLTGNFLMTQLPLVPTSISDKLFNVNFAANHSLATRSAGDQEDELLNYRYGTNYAVPWQVDILPTDFLTFKPLPTLIAYEFSQNNSFQKLSKDNTDTRSAEESYNLSTSFQFIPQLSLTPTYNFRQTFEERKGLDSSKALTAIIQDSLGKYNKKQYQSVALSGNLRLISWFNPSFNYSIITDETYNINEVLFGSSTFKRGSLKNINRKSNANISASLSPRDIFQYVPYLRAVNPAINSLNFSGGYTVDDADTYDNMDSGYYARDQLVIRGRTLNLTGQNSNARRTNLTATDTDRMSGRWSPFEQFNFLTSRLWTPLKNINTTGSFTETKTRRDTTGTESFTYSRVWPDLTASTYALEKFLPVSRWVSETRLDGSYQERLSEVRDQTLSKGLRSSTNFAFTLFKYLRFSVGHTNDTTEDMDIRTQQVTGRSRSQGINGQVITEFKWGNWRFTPRYDQSQSESEDGKGKKTSDLITRNGRLGIFGDISIPALFRLPLGKELTLKNRLILTSSINYLHVRNSVDDTGSKDSVDSNVNGDFEITPNIRVGFGGGYSITFFKVKKEENFSTFTLSSRITIQF